MGQFKHLYCLIFRPQQFVQNITELTVKKDRLENPSIISSEGEYPPERRAGIQVSVSNQTKNIRQGFTRGIVSTALTIFLGATVGIGLRYIFGEPVKSVVYIFQALGAAVILGATLAEVGGDIMTWNRTTIPEQINKLVFQGLYILGTFLFVLSVAWDAN